MFISAKIKYKFIIGLFFLCLIPAVGFSQSHIEKIIKSTEYINKDKFLNLFIGKYGPWYLPVFVEYNDTVEKKVVMSIDIFLFYKKKWGVDFYSDENLYNEYRKIQKNLLLGKDTLEIDSSFFVNGDETFLSIPSEHYIYNTPDSAKKEIIESYFDQEGYFIEDSINAFAPLVNKLAEWYVFIIRQHTYGGDYDMLFECHNYYREDNNDLYDIIYESLRLFIEQNSIDEPVNIITSGFPIHITSLQDIGVESKTLYFIDPKDKNIKDIKVITLDKIKINDNVITIFLSYNKCDYSKKRGNVLSYTLYKNKYLYKYVEEKQIWQNINENQTDF